MNCIICDKVFTGIENLKQHEASEKHKKKVQIHKLSTINSKANSHNFAEIPKVQNLQTISCHPCSKTFNNLIEFQNHCVSEEHARMVLKGKSEQDSANNKLPVSECSLDILRKQISQLDIKPGQPVNFSRCDICSKNFSGPESYFQHIASAAHKKKALAASPSTSTAALLQFNCKICSKTFSGPVPYQQHLESDNHKKKLLFASYMNETPPVVASHKYTTDCYICKEHFADPELYQQHINTDNHKNLSVLNEKCNVMDVLNCNTCDKQFTGPLPYDQHMKSEVHKKKVSLKFMIQQVNEEKNKVSSLYKTVSPTPLLADYYCEFCVKQCTNAASYKEHLSSVQHAKKFVESAVEFKRNEIQNLLSSQLSDSSVKLLCQMTQSEDENMLKKSVNVYPDMGSVNIIKTVSFENDVKWSSENIFDNFNITVFQAGEEIDFDKKTRDDYELNTDCDENDEDIIYEEYLSS